MRTDRRLAALLSLVLAAGFAPLARAQGTARSQDIDTSIRAAGMGGAGAAVWWGEPGVWGNPAALAEFRGLGWLEGRTGLVPGLAPDVQFRSRRFLMGGGGLGISLMGEPLEGLGRTRLDYGRSQGTDPFGNPTGTFSSYEQIEGWGVGLSPLQLFDALRSARQPGTPSATRTVDFAAGLQRKHTKLVFGAGTTSGSAEADCVDWGVSGRVAPLQWLAPEAPLQLDVSGGFAVLNANDASFVFLFENRASPPSRIRRIGFAVHAALPAPWSASDASGPWAWWHAAAPHAFELGIAGDTEHISAGGTGPGHEVQRFGLELTVLGMITGRLGHVTDRIGDIVDNTYGFGARLPLGPWASVAYDFGSVPQSSSLEERVTRQGLSAWLDPVAIWRDAR